MSIDWSTLGMKQSEILHQTDGNMPLSLQDKCTLSVLGYCEADSSGNGQPEMNLTKTVTQTCSTDGGKTFPGSQSVVVGKNGIHACGCHKVHALLEQLRLAFVQNENWFQLISGFPQTTGRKLQLIPELHHLHWNGETISQLDLHVIIYEIPKFSSHHYSLGSRSLSEKMRSSIKKPQWFEDLKQKKQYLDLDTVILAINSAHAAKILSERQLPVKSCAGHFKPLWMFPTFTWKFFAALVALLATSVYVILQSFHILLSYMSCIGIDVVLVRAFNNTWTNIGIRCSQFLYWPILLRGHGHRSESCIEYSEKVALRRHSIWSCLVVDVLLGNLFGISLWYQAEPACLFISNFAVDVTNYLLRTGCVWLMGNPAGFKLNTELAGVLGMISLNTIQIWSTLGSFMDFFLVPIAKAISLCGILFGFTTAAALIIDLISLVTRHVFVLHWILSLVYSQQIQALAALWRLFRGRKWNPLRQRLDSYDYTVEQHVVGSLLFTPLLLLLPTTSVFYTFFTIMNTVISFICVVMEVSISVIHTTPYNSAFLWLMRKKRFPSGIWLEIVCRQHGTTVPSVIDPLELNGSLSKKSPKIPRSGGRKTLVLVSVLHSNYLSLGELICPSYRYIYSVVSRTAISSSAYGILTGKRILSAPGTTYPSRLPWMALPYKIYWRLCFEAVFACR
ncbi:uncharacterized protein [Coffea arabica]|uniref:Uncharacterized protein isoform X2 n=1 Tax=Coffea arabica TaxID=13443 RepID=A0ABM4UWE3_COFAR|nr:phosphatidylinositol N-acetylglucosaminyltransferase subunit GPI1-like isoform X2 [Coffea arabica]